MFNTDDGVFYNDVFLDEEILSEFKKDPENTSYRMYVGDNIEGFLIIFRKRTTFTSGTIMQIRRSLTGRIHSLLTELSIIQSIC
jgi:hypothetical protein